MCRRQNRRLIMTPSAESRIPMLLPVEFDSATGIEVRTCDSIFAARSIVNLTTEQDGSNSNQSDDILAITPLRSWINLFVAKCGAYGKRLVIDAACVFGSTSGSLTTLRKATRDFTRLHFLPLSLQPLS